jgi:hypothetical protein
VIHHHHVVCDGSGNAAISRIKGFCQETADMSPWTVSSLSPAMGNSSSYIVLSALCVLAGRVGSK